MKKMWVVLCLVALVSLSAWAQNRKPATVKEYLGDTAANPEKVAPAAVVKHVLKNMYNSTGVPSLTMVSGPNAADSAITVSCPGTSGTCLIQADQWIHLDELSGDIIGICLYVDGTEVNGCYIQGSVANFVWTMESVSQGIAVSHGNHTVQTYVYDVNGGSTLGYYNVNYYVFKP